MDKGTIEHPAPGRSHDKEPDFEMSAEGERHNKRKVLAVMSVAIVLGAFGDIALSRGMKLVGATEHQTLLDAFIFAATNPFVLGGVGLLVSFLFLYLASLSWADLSFVLPLTAADYVLVTLLAYFVLGEPVSHMRWVGSILVASGVALVART